MFRYQPGIRHAHYLILQQPCLHYGISTPTLQIGSHFHPTSLIRRQWLSRYPLKSLGATQEERGQLDVYPSDQKITKAHSGWTLGSRSIKLDTGSGDQEFSQAPESFKDYSKGRLQGKERRLATRKPRVEALGEVTKSHSERKLGSKSTKLNAGSGDQELSQALENLKPNAKERRRAARKPKVEAMKEARQVLRNLRKEQKKKRQLSDQPDSSQLGTGLNDSESSPPPKSISPKNEQIDSSNAGGIKVQKINRALEKALRKLKSYPEWVAAQEKPTQPPLVRRIENVLPLVHKVPTRSSLLVSESQDSTATTTAEPKHPPLVRKIAHESGIHHFIPESSSPNPEESHKSSSFNVSEDQARDLDDRKLKISYEASKKLRIAFFPARDSSPPSLQTPETPNPEPMGSEQHPIPSIRRVGVEVKVDPDKPLIRYTGSDASSTDPPDEEEFNVYGLQVKLLEREQRKRNKELRKLPDGAVIRKCWTGDKTEEELRKLEIRMERRRRREERRELAGAKTGMTKREKRMDRKARKKERSRLLKIQRREKAAKKGMAYKEFIAKTKEQEVEQKKRKDELKEKLRLEELARLERMKWSEEEMALEVKRRMVLLLEEGKMKLASGIKREVSPTKRNALMELLRSKIKNQVRKEMSRKEAAMKLERDPDLDQQVREVFSPARQERLPATIKLMVKKELKAKAEEEREREIQRDPVLAKLLSSRDEPIRPGVKFAAERVRRNWRIVG